MIKTGLMLSFLRSTKNMLRILIGQHQMQQEVQRCGQETIADVHLSALNVLTAFLSLTASREYQLVTMR